MLLGIERDPRHEGEGLGEILEGEAAAIYSIIRLSPSQPVMRLVPRAYL